MSRAQIKQNPPPKSRPTPAKPAITKSLSSTKDTGGGGTGKTSSVPKPRSSLVGISGAKTSDNLINGKMIEKSSRVINAAVSRDKSETPRGGGSVAIKKVPPPVINNKPQTKAPPVKSSTSGVNSKNVMNTVHNVTVASPPSKRREILEPEEVNYSTKMNQEFQQKPRNRTRTRTIDPEESVMQRILQQRGKEQPAVDKEMVKPPEPTPSPIAFEISLDSTENSRKEKKEKVDIKKEEKKEEVKDTVPEKEEEEEDNEYDDDFESYESDFESEPTEDEEEEQEENPSGDEEKDEEPEIIFPRGEEERKLDSGNYDLPVSSKDRPLLAEIQETTEIEANFPIPVLKKNPPPTNQEKFSLSSRQLKAMKNFSATTMTFHLFEQQPMEYERFMRVFGRLSSSQSAVQTKFEDVCDEEMQTEVVEMETKWTQDPPKFSNNKKKFISKGSELYREEAIGVGKDRKEKERREIGKDQPIDYERLNVFLKKSSVVIGQIVEGQAKDEEGESEIVEIKSVIVGKMAKDCKVKKSFVFEKVVVVVYGREGGASGKDVIEVYDSSYLKEPQSVLTSWNKISTVLIHCKCPSFLFGGSSDGSINLWNWMGATSSHDESLLHLRPPVSSFIPKFLDTLEGDYCALIKLVDITTDSSYSISGADLAALYSPGIIVIFSLQIIHGSVSLQEVKTIELTNKPMVSKGVRTKFEKNVTYFENNIFSDAALKELQTIQTEVDQSENLNFIDLIFDGEFLVSISNQNFVIVTTIGLTNEARKIVVADQTSAIKVTAAAVFSPKVILIGLSDGTLKIQSISSGCHSKEDMEENIPDMEEVNNHELMADKSCAIQNIVLSERKLYNEVQAKRNLDSLEVKEGQSASGKELRSPLKDLDRILIHGNYFKRNGIKDICLSENSIYFLSSAKVQEFNLITEHVKDVEMDKNKNLKGLNLIKNSEEKNKILVISGDSKLHLCPVHSA